MALTARIGQWVAALVLFGGLAAATAQPMLSDPFDLGRRAYDARQFAEARQLWLPLAEAGDHRAQFAMATLYNEGAGVPQSLERAFYWYMKSAEQGFPAAQYNVGNAYRHGYGVAQDNEEALRWWQMASEQGVNSASFNIGTLYYYGDGVARDEEEAFRWYRLSARQGHPIAREMFGLQPMPGGDPLAESPEPPTPGPIASASPGADTATQPERRPIPRFEATDLPAVTAADQDSPASVAPTTRAAVPPSSRTADAPLAERERPPEAAVTPEAADVASSPRPPDPEPVVPPPEEAPSSAVSTASAGEMVLYSADWLSGQDPNHFTIQLTALSDEARITRFITRHRLRGELAYFAFDRDGRTLYAVVAGVYPSREQARAALAGLPESVRSGSPWVRTLDDIQRLIADQG